MRIEKTALVLVLQGQFSHFSHRFSHVLRGFFSLVSHAFRPWKKPGSPGWSGTASGIPSAPVSSKGGGVPLLTVQKLAGHKNYATTLVYAHLSPDHLHEAVGILSGKNPVFGPDRHQIRHQGKMSGRGKSRKL